MKTILEDKINFLSLNSKFFNFRSIILLIGSDAKKKIPFLQYNWSKNSTETNTSLLWCYSSNNFLKNNSNMKKKKRGKIFLEPCKFLKTVKVRYCYYTEIDSILGNTFGMCILENFEALSPNILVKIIIYS